MRVEYVTKEKWEHVSEDAHKLAFGEIRPRDFDRMDFALVMVGTDEKAVGYATCREFDKYTLYLQYGGAFEKNRHRNVGGYRELIGWIKSRDYKQAVTLVENDNIAYLKMAMHFGFRIIGCRNFRGAILLELMLDLEEK